MYVKFIEGTHLDYLKTSIIANLPNYAQPASWIHEFFDEGSQWELESTVPCHGFELIHPEGGRHYDLENVRILYSRLKHLTPAQAGDERLWAYMTHVSFWEYMRLRWPVDRHSDEGKQARMVRERYFFMSNRDRALVRNGLARLWWYGYASYDEKRSDPYELTSILLGTQDLALSLLERSFSRSRQVIIAVLKAVQKYKEEFDEFPSRKVFRAVMINLNKLGGTLVLDCLPAQYVEDTVFDWLIKESES